jgi:hypothetical protein
MSAAVGACARCQSPLEAGDLRCAICSLPIAAHASAAAKAIIEVLRCDGCGAAVEYDVRAASPKCAFCGSVAHVERSEDPPERAELVVPFRVDVDTARAALRAWLGTRGFFRPSDLASSATIDQLRPLLFVAWVFDCEGLVSWAADSDHGAGRSAWAPHAGQTSMTAERVLVSASRGLTAEEVEILSRHYDLGTAAPAGDAPPEVTAERFDVQRSAARSTIAGAIRSVAAREAARFIPGSRYRNLKVDVLLRRLVTRRCAFPAYVLAYRYRGDLYRAVVHGQDARVVHGKSPLSIAKIALVVGGALLAIALVLAFIAVVLALGAR